jgi:hypothetical protein
MEAQLSLLPKTRTDAPSATAMTVQRVFTSKM